jgi:phosphoserine aminotransferase
MVPMNLIKIGQMGAYINSGFWAKDAITDARPYGEVYNAWEGTECNYTRMPRSEEINTQRDQYGKSAECL